MRVQDRFKIRDIIREWDRITGMDTDKLRPVVVEAWDRCRELDVEPSTIDYLYLEKVELQEKREEKSELLEAAWSCMHKFDVILSGIPHVLALADEEGWILKIAGNIEEFGGKEAGIWEGSNWSEAVIGNNGIGTALIREEPAFIYGVEHYGQPYKSGACFGVPIRDHRDKIVGALDISVPLEYAHPERLLFALICVESIESKLHEDSAEYTSDNLFISLMHELNTPLSTIFTALELLNSSQLEGNSPYLRLMEKNTYRLLKLAENTIDITKIEAAQFDLNLKNQSLVCLIQEVIRGVKAYIGNRSLEFSFERKLKDKAIAFDRSAIKRVMLNLVTNAVKATASDGKINVRVYKTGQELAVAVSDNGHGIAINHQQQIFDKYYRCNKSLARAHEGFGLGLYLVKHLLEYHKGRVTVDSQVGQGSTFTFFLPDKQVYHSGKERSETPGVSPLTTLSIYKKEFSDIYV